MHTKINKTLFWNWLQRPTIVWTTAAWIIFFTSLAMIVSRFYLGKVPTGLIFNPDIVYIHLVVEDFLIDPLRLARWTLPSVTFLFPDFPLFALAALLSSKIYVQYTLFALLQLTTLNILIYHILRLRYASAMAIFFTATIFLLLAGLLDVDFFPLNTSITPLIHFGSVLFYLLTGLLVMRCILSKKPSKAQIAMVGLSSFLAVFSDKLIVIQFHTPFLLFLIYYASRRPEFDARPLFFAIGGSCVAAMAALKLLLPEAPQANTTFALSNLEENLRLFSLALLDLGQNKSIFYPVVFSLSAIATMLLVGRNWLASVQRGWDNLQPMAAFLIGSLAFNLIFVLVSNQVFTPRYVLPLYFLPVLCVVPLIYEVSVICGMRPIYLPLLGMGIAGTLTVNAQVMFLQTPAHRQGFNYYPETVACIDNVVRANQLKRGMAGYMQAKTIQGLSREKITLAQYKTPFLTKDHWETSDSHFSPRYDFALIDINYTGGDRVDMNEVKRINGEDISFADCDSLRIYFYASKSIRTNQ